MIICQGHNWALATLATEQRWWLNLLHVSNLSAKNSTHGWLVSLTRSCTLRLAAPPCRSRLQMTFVSHQMLCGRCHSIYCHHDLLVQNDQRRREEHIKKARRWWRRASECQRLRRLSALPSQHCTFCSWLLFGHLLQLKPPWQRREANMESVPNAITFFLPL